MELIQLLLGLIFGWIFWAYLIGGVILWYIVMLLIAQIVYDGDGARAANTAAWGSFALSFIASFLISYFLWDRWEKIAILTLAGTILPFIATLWFTTLE